MNKVVRHGVKTYNSFLTRSLGVFPNRVISLKSSVLQPPEHSNNTNNDSCNLQIKLPTFAKMYLFENVLEGRSVEEIMNYLKEIEPSKVSLDNIVVAIERLMDVQYDSLYQQNHWMQRHHHIAYIQLLLNNSLQSSMQSFLHHPFYPRLHQLLTDNLHAISPQHLGSCFLHLCYLGMPLHDPLMAHLLTDIQKRFGLMPLKEVATMSQIFKSLPGFNNTLYRNTLSRLKEVTSHCNVPQQQLVQVSNILANFQKLVSPAFALHLSKWFVGELKGRKAVEDIDDISTLLRFTQSFFSAFPNCRLHLFEVVGELMGGLRRKVDEMESHHVAEVCRIFKAIKYPCEAFSRRVEERVADLLEHQDLRLNEVVNLMHCLSTTSPPSLTTSCGNLLYSKLMQPMVKVDVIFLSNVVDCLLDMRHVNEDLLPLVHQMTASHATNIVSFVSRFSSFKRFLDHHPFKDPRDQHLFTTAVIHHLEGLYSVSLLSSSILSRHLLFLRSHHCFPHHLYLRFLSSLSRYASTDLCRLMRSLYANEASANHHQKLRYIQVLGVIQQELLSRVSNLRRLNDLLPLSSCKQNATLSSRHSLLSQHVEDALLSLSEVRNLEQANILTQIMSVNQFYLPSVYDHLFYFLQHEPSRYFNLSLLLTSASKIGYTLSNFDCISPIISEYYFSDVKNTHFHTALSLLWSLALMQCFPEHLLQHLFSLPTLHALDAYLAEHKEEHRGMEMLLLQLNRSVVLEQPQLNIPWFHSSTDLQVDPNRRRREETMVAEVGERLLELLGGEKMLRRDSVTPYHHSIDFEVLTDGDKKVLDPSTDPLSLPTTAQRLAILVYQNYSYCKNSKVLKGRQQMKHRHLRILNYKVIQIPYTDWYSMGLSENSMKLKYLKNKIFEK